MSSMSSSSSLKGIEGNPLHFTKRAENYPQHEVKALRAALKESEQRLSALEAKFDSLSHKPEEAGEKGVRPLQENWQMGSRSRRICMPTQAER